MYWSCQRFAGKELVVARLEQNEQCGASSHAPPTLAARGFTRRREETWETVDPEWLLLLCLRRYRLRSAPLSSFLNRRSVEEYRAATLSFVGTVEGCRSGPSGGEAGRLRRRGEGAVALCRPRGKMTGRWGRQPSLLAGFFFVSAGEQQGEGEMGKWSGCCGWFLEKKKIQTGAKTITRQGGSFGRRLWGKRNSSWGYCSGQLRWKKMVGPAAVLEKKSGGCWKKNLKAGGGGFLVCSFGREGWSRKIQAKGGAAVFAKKMGNGGVKNAPGRGGCFG
ncbi:hypothetical protein NC651_031147 [Populus alba x Populus x berolinensis]|nr:hypothetical protein NC651_031147 [Populus alba x Populus x berolinensis]